jgi:hypothetical protein
MRLKAVRTRATYLRRSEFILTRILHVELTAALEGNFSFR